MQEENAETHEIIKIEKKNKIEIILIQICYIIGIIITISIGIASFILTYYFTNTYSEYLEYMNYRIDNLLLNAIGVVLFLIVIYIVKKLLKKVSNKIFLIVTTIIIMLLSAIFICIARILPKADQEVMTYLASEFMKGNYDALETDGYLNRFPFQLGYMYLTELLFRLVRESTIVMQLLNVICIGGIIILLYKFTNKMFQNKEVNKIFCLLMLGFLPIVFFSTFVYGNIIGLLFALIAIYSILLYIGKRKMKYLIIASISIGISILLKKNYQIFFVGIVVLLILDFIEKRDKKIWVGIILSAICMILFNKIIFLYTEKRTGIEIADGVPMISYIQMGLKEGSETKMAGWYDGSVVSIYQEANGDTAKASERSMNNLEEILNDFSKNPSKIFKVLTEKIATTWLEPTFQTIWINEPAENFNKIPESMKNNKLLISFFDGKLSIAYIEYNNIYEIIIFITAGICLIIGFKRTSIERLSLILMVIGGFFFHLIWETKCYYVLTFYILLLPYAANGIYIVFEKINDFSHTIKNRSLKIERNESNGRRTKEDKENC